MAFTITPLYSKNQMIPVPSLSGGAASRTAWQTMPDWHDQLQIEHATEAMWNLKMGTERMFVRKLGVPPLTGEDMAGPEVPMNLVNTEKVLLACITKFDLVVVPREQHEAHEELVAAVHKQGPYPRDIGAMLAAMNRIMRFFYTRNLPFPDWLK